LAKGQTEENSQETSNEVFISLHAFAQANAKKLGVELMGGFYHSQETAKSPHLADTEANWNALFEEFSNREVK
jgi:hypothetical protein